MKSKNITPITHLTLTTRVSPSDHRALHKTAQLLHAKPGVLAAWLLQIYATGKADLNRSRLISLDVVANALFKLSQLLFSLLKALDREVEGAEPGSVQCQRAQQLHAQLGPHYQRTLAAIEIAQGIAASQVGRLPAEVQADAKAAKKILAAVPTSAAGDVAKLAAYLRALQILS